MLDDTEPFHDKLKEWEDFHDFSRPHGSLGGQTPYQRLGRDPGLGVNEHRQLHG